MASPPIDTFELETAAGFRQLVFDYDVFRGKDVRILVDGREVARLPCPTAESPRQEVSLSVEGHQLLAIAEARNRGALLVYDLFHDDLSLKNGANLGQSRAAAPRPSARKPLAHRIVEAIIHIATVGGASGLGAGAVTGIGRLGLPVTILLIAAGLGALWLGNVGAHLCGVGCCDDEVGPCGVSRSRDWQASSPPSSSRMEHGSSWWPRLLADRMWSSRLSQLPTGELGLEVEAS